jgi:hypothetical protein
VAKAYGGLETLPYTVLVDRKGRVAATVDHVLEEGALRKVLELLLAEPARTDCDAAARHPTNAEWGRLH